MKNYFYKFSILLPIKIEEGKLIPSQSKTLNALADSIDPNELHHQVVVYLAIDDEEVSSKALMDIKRIFSSKNVSTTLTTFKREHSGQICIYWSSLADKAVEDGSDFFVLLGDDTEIHQRSWTDSIIEDFEVMHSSRNLPSELFGFGTIAIVDHQAYGFPTFPVLHRIHYEMNNGKLFDSCFINQDADPFLFQLYRRFGVAKFSSSVTLTNRIGGVELAADESYVRPRYSRKNVCWNNHLLDSAVRTIRSNLNLKISPGLSDYCTVCTVDVIIPSYRVNRTFLQEILSLTSTDTSKVDIFFIVIVDNPNADITWLTQLQNERLNVRVRKNVLNQGASVSRNVGMSESGAEYILFLDDDVIPMPDIVDRYVEAARAHPAYDGFVGTSYLRNKDNSANGIFHTAVHFSGVSFFWLASLSGMKYLPWGVTANLFVRRPLSSVIRFDPRYFKTGGGEDIDFCLRLEKQPLVPVPLAVVVHPWWDAGRRCYGHFFNWSRSDGILVDAYPKLTYISCPDLVETMVLNTLIVPGVFGFSVWFYISIALMLTDVIMDISAIYPDTSKEGSCKGLIRLLACMESCLIKNINCFGRLFGHIQRGNLHNFCLRFDWFCGLEKNVVVGEKVKAFWRFSSFLGISVLVLSFLNYHSKQQNSTSYSSS